MVTHSNIKGRHASSQYPGSKNPPPQKKKSGGLSRVVFWIALVVFVCSLIALGVIGYSYWKGQDTYSNVADMGGANDLAGKSLAEMQLDWDALREANPDTVGWVFIPGTKVNYPVVHTTDDEKYLTVDFLQGRGTTVQYGAIFLMAGNKPDFSDQNNVIYGHNMQDGSMFAHFATLGSSEEFNKHRVIYFLTPERNYLLDTFSFVAADASEPLAQPSFTEEDSFKSYLEDKIARNQVALDPAAADPATIEKLFTFVTCANSYDQDARVVVFSHPVQSVVPGDTEDGSTIISDEEARRLEDAAKEME